MLFAQTLFGAIFVSVGQNVPDNQLIKRLTGISSITPQQIQDAGATGLFDIIPPQYHTVAREAYNSLRVCFQIALILARLSILGALGMEWVSVKRNKEGPSLKNPSPRNLEGEQTMEEGQSRSQSRDTEANDPKAVSSDCGERDEVAAAGQSVRN